MKNILRFAFLLTLFSAALFADSLNDLNGVVAGDLKVPFYNNERLQAMVFAQSAEYREQLLFGKDVFINLVSRNADTDKVANDNSFPLYPLNAPLAEVAKFWLPVRYQYSDAVIWTQEAVIDRISRSASGNVVVKMRSPLIDLDGIGFYSDFQKRQIRVNKEIDITLRMAGCDPREFQNKIPLKYEFLRGKGDMLHLDLAENRIMLIGNVKIENEQVQLLCDRLTILLGGEKNKSEEDFSLGAAGVSAIYADGHVKIRKLENGKEPKEVQEARCDHLVFDVVKDRLTLTNDTGSPRIVYGKNSFAEGQKMIFFRKNQQAIFPEKCRMLSFDPKAGKRELNCDYGNLKLNDGVCDLLGNVRMISASEDLKCDRMRVYLKKEGNRSSGQEKVADKSLIGDMKVNASEIERAVCKGNICMKRADKVGSSDSGTLFCKQLDLYFGKAAGKQIFRNAVATGNVKIVRIDSDGKAVLTAAKGVFDYLNNRIEFNDPVHCIKGKSTLDCQKLELFLTDKKERSGVDVSDIMSSGGGKTLDHIAASGNVRMVDDTNTLNADSCKLFFAPAKPGDARKPGFFQSGSLRLVKILCDGNINAKTEKSGPAMRELRSSGARTLLAQHSVTDLVRQTAVFFDNVSMFDQDKRLDCNKMELFAVPYEKTKEKKSEAASIDDDPFELPAENSVPKSVVFNDNMQLKEVVASDKVVVTRSEGGKPTQQLFCDKATFDGDKMIVTCESAPPKRPRLKASGMEQTAEQYRILLLDERIEAVGETHTQSNSLDEKE